MTSLYGSSDFSFICSNFDFNVSNMDVSKEKGTDQTSEKGKQQPRDGLKDKVAKSVQVNKDKRIEKQDKKRQNQRKLLLHGTRTEATQEQNIADIFAKLGLSDSDAGNLTKQIIASSKK